MADPAGEADRGALRLDFDRRLLLQFRGLAITSDVGLLPYRELHDRREGCESRPLRHLPNGRNRGATVDVRRYPVADRPTAGTACASMSGQRDQMRQATAKVCLDLAKSARFIVSVLSTASFNRPLLELSTICRCPNRSKERSWPRNRGHLANVHLS